MDPASTDIIHRNNIKRVIRALDFYHKNGKPISEHNAIEKAKELPYDVRYFVLTMDRARLYERIDMRVDMMFDEGLVDEVIALKKQGLNGSHISMQGIGYKELLPFIDSDFTITP